jgi:hypothetical protein
MGVETFSYRKLFGVLASLAGVALISWSDFSGRSDEHRGNFPHKDPVEVSSGDGLALLSAVLYGIYTTRFKKRVGDESKVDMLLFLGCVGVVNALFLWPGFFVLDATGWEKFEWPDTPMVRKIVLVCRDDYSNAIELTQEGQRGYICRFRPDLGIRRRAHHASGRYRGLEPFDSAFYHRADPYQCPGIQSLELDRCCGGSGGVHRC